MKDIFYASGAFIFLAGLINLPVIILGCSKSTHEVVVPRNPIETENAFRFADNTIINKQKLKEATNIKLIKDYGTWYIVIHFDQDIPFTQIATASGGLITGGKANNNAPKDEIRLNAHHNISSVEYSNAYKVERVFAETFLEQVLECYEKSLNDQ